MKKHLCDNKAKILRLFFLMLTCLAITAVASACTCANYYYSKGNYVKDEDTIEFAPTEEEEFETLPEEEEQELLEKLELDRKKAFDELTNAEDDAPVKTKKQSTSGNRKAEGAEDKNGETEASDAAGEKEDSGSVDVYYSDKVYNLMLIGVDRRDKSWNGNSDTMILMSINYDKQKVTMTSFMRDTWVNIPGVGMRKMNAAFAIGGGPLLVQTVAVNFGIAVDNYAWIDFDGMIAVINILGGVDVELTAAEGQFIGVPVSGASSVVHLNGEQALAYARDRTTSGWDYGRTQRQRNILMAIVNKAKGGGYSDITGLANAVLPYTTHNMDQNRMMTLMMNLPKITGFAFQEQRVPYDGLYYSQNQNLVPDYAATIKRLYEAIY